MEEINSRFLYMDRTINAMLNPQDQPANMPLPASNINPSQFEVPRTGSKYEHVKDQFQPESGVGNKSEPGPRSDNQSEPGPMQEKRKAWPCQSCGRSYMNQQGLYKHFKQKPECGFRCQNCNQPFSTKKELTDHMNLSKERGRCPDPIPLKNICPFCCKEFSNKNDLRLHKPIHNERKYECHLCAKRLMSKQNLQEHMKRMHREGQDNMSDNNTQKVWECPRCDQTFTERSRLRFHSYIHTRGKTLECTVCNKTFSTQWGLKTHMTSHNNTQKHLCSHCGAKFAFLGALIRHMDKHLRNKDKPGTSGAGGEGTNAGSEPGTRLGEFCCTICERQFAHAHSLRLHMELHTNVTPYKCICGQRFNRRWNLNKHRKENPACAAAMIPYGERYQYMRALKYGELIKKKQFECSRCGLKLSSKESLAKHIACRHDQSREHKCHICNTVLTSGTYLRIHLLTRHKPKVVKGKKRGRPFRKKPVVEETQAEDNEKSGGVEDPLTEKVGEMCKESEDGNKPVCKVEPGEKEFEDDQRNRKDERELSTSSEQKVDTSNHWDGIPGQVSNAKQDVGEGEINSYHTLLQNIKQEPLDTSYIETDITQTQVDLEPHIADWKTDSVKQEHIESGIKESAPDNVKSDADTNANELDQTLEMTCETEKESPKKQERTPLSESLGDEADECKTVIKKEGSFDELSPRNTVVKQNISPISEQFLKDAECRICKKEFKSKRDLKRHHVRAHVKQSTANAPPKGQDTWNCQVCYIVKILYSFSFLSPLHYRPRSEGDNVLDSVCPSIRLSVRLSADTITAKPFDLRP